MKKNKKYSEGFNTSFKFFYEVYRKDIITFCGSAINVEFDINEPSAKETFKNFENGKYKLVEVIKTRHPNIVKAVLTGKKGWGLWRDEWAKGIWEGSFLKAEILDEFSSRNVTIPESFMTEFKQSIYKNYYKL